MREAFLWCVRRGLTRLGPPLGKVPKEGDTPPPHPPSFGVGREIEQGKARFMSLQMADE